MSHNSHTLRVPQSLQVCVEATKPGDDARLTLMPHSATWLGFDEPGPLVGVYRGVTVLKRLFIFASLWIGRGSVRWATARPAFLRLPRR